MNAMDGLAGSDIDACLNLEAVTLPALYLCHNFWLLSFAFPSLEPALV